MLGFLDTWYRRVRFLAEQLEMRAESLQDKVTLLEERIKGMEKDTLKEFRTREAFLVTMSTALVKDCGQLRFLLKQAMRHVRHDDGCATECNCGLLEFRSHAAEICRLESGSCWCGCHKPSPVMEPAS